MYVGSLGMERASKADSLAPGVEHGVVSMEEVEPQDPVCHIRRVHQSQLALASGVLHVGTGWELVSDVVDFEGDILEAGKVVPCAHGCREAVLEFVEVQFRVLLRNDGDEQVKVLARNQSQTCACVHYQLIDLDCHCCVAVHDATHGQRPVVGVKQVVPNDIALGVCFQIVAPDHNFALLKVFPYGEGKQVLIDFPIQVELLDEECGSLTTGNGGQSDDAVTSHS